MKLKAYSIYDRKGMMYNTPFFSHTDGMATRSFQDLVNDPGAALHLHPADYVLYLVGEFDDQTGQLTPVVPLIHICDAQTLVVEKGAPDFASQFRRRPPQQPMPNGEDR